MNWGDEAILMQVVKQTVMTTVYGVTMIGARLQIQVYDGDL